VQDRVEQLEQMRMGIDYRFTVAVRQYRLSLRPLSIIETVQVAGKVQERLGEVPPTSRTALLEHCYLAKETLILASTSDVGANDPKVTDYVLDRCTPAELSDLFKQYVSGCDRCNPSLEKLDQEELDSLVAALKKSDGDPAALASQLTELSLLELASLSFFLLTKGD
jgi:hypothetical protein